MSADGRIATAGATPTARPAAAPGPGPQTAAALRAWLRLLACTNAVEAEIRRRLRDRFGVTLPRFDLLAQLAKAPDGLALGELSRRMMVSNGNVTGLVDRLVADGLIARETAPHDRRSATVRLTEAGACAFAEMAAEHGAWVAELFADLSPDEVAALGGLVTRLKASAAPGAPRDARGEDRTTP